VNSLAACVGDNCVDEYLPPVSRSFIGGNAANVAVFMQRAGVATAYLGAVGDDPAGAWIVYGLRRQGLDVSHVQVHPGPSARSHIRLSASGDREFVHEDLGPKERFALAADDLDFIARHRLVHNTFLGGSEGYLADFKRTPGLLVSMDYGERCPPELIAETIALVDLAFFSLPEERRAEAEDLAAEMRARGPRLVVVTFGKLGSLACDGDYYTQPAFPVQVVDTLGAGDTYIGVFLAGWLQGLPMQECMRRASREAAQTCTHYGAWV